MPPPYTSDSGTQLYGQKQKFNHENLRNSCEIWLHTRVNDFFMLPYEWQVTCKNSGLVTSHWRRWATICQTIYFTINNLRLVQKWIRWVEFFCDHVFAFIVLVIWSCRHLFISSLCSLTFFRDTKTHTSPICSENISVLSGISGDGSNKKIHFVFRLFFF